MVVSMPEIIGAVDIAIRFDLDEAVVLDWADRALMPPPEGYVAGSPAWRWLTVRDWATRTGRLGLEAAVLEVLRQRSGHCDLPTIHNTLAEAGIFTEVEPAQLIRTLEDLQEGDMVARLPGDCWSLSPQPMY